MRLLALLLLALATISANAQSDTAPRVGKNYGNTPKHHVRMQVDADHLALPVAVTIKGKDRAAVDARIEGIRAELDLRNEKINYKVREHSLAKVPVMLVIGKKEAEAGTVAVRRMGGADQEILALEDAIVNLSGEQAAPSA